MRFLRSASKGENKKIIGAKKIEFDGIEFRSALEMKAYKVLKGAGLKFDYEPKPIVLLEGWKCNIERFIKGKWETGHKVREWTYTPDFVIYNGNRTIFVEMKGFGNDNLPLKRKMFLKYLEDNYKGDLFGEVAEYWEVYKISELETLISKL